MYVNILSIFFSKTQSSIKMSIVQTTTKCVPWKISLRKIEMVVYKYVWRRVWMIMELGHGTSFVALRNIYFFLRLAIVVHIMKTAKMEPYMRHFAMFCQSSQWLKNCQKGLISSRFYGFASFMNWKCKMNLLYVQMRERLMRIWEEAPQWRKVTHLSTNWRTGATTTRGQAAYLWTSLRGRLRYSVSCYWGEHLVTTTFARRDFKDLLPEQF